MSLSSTTNDTQQLALIHGRNDQRLKQQGDGKVQLAFARDVKNSLLFQYDWGELLSAAPLALYLIGSCYVAATSPLARGVSLSDAVPKDGFKYLQHDMLKACLVQISNAGQKAFLITEKNMTLINSTSNSLSGYMQSISNHLPELPAPAAEYALKDKLQLMKDGSNACLDYARTIERAFNDWLDIVRELYEVTVSKEEKISLAHYEHKVDIDGVSLEAELTQTDLSHAQETAKDLKKQLDESREMFKKAADAMPSAWGAVALNFIDSLHTSATTIVSQAIPSGGRNADALPKAHAKLWHPKTVPDDSNDPAYPAAVVCSDMLITLSTMLDTNPEDGPDWQSFIPKEDSGMKSGLTCVKVTLKHQIDNVQWTEAAPSIELRSAISYTLAVIDELEKFVPKDHELVSATQKPDAQVVRKWQSVVSEANAKVMKMSTFARSMPGGAPTSFQLSSMPKTSPSTVDPTAQRSALSAAQHKLSMTQAAYISSQQNHTEASSQVVKVEAKLARVKANLQKLEKQHMTMVSATFKKILTQSIGTLIQMKAQITNLVLFFNALSAMVEHVVSQNIKDFIQQVDSATRVLMGGMSLLDVSRQELYNISVMCQAYFSLFKSVSQMYLQISRQYIIPGVALCDELSLSIEGDDDKIAAAVATRTKKLGEYSDNAQGAIRAMITKNKEQVAASLENRVRVVAEDLKMLPNLQPNMAKAITEGSEMLTSAVQKGLDNYTPPAIAAAESISFDLSVSRTCIVQR
ncbi:uncharacterized protein LAESUDRAFT_663435 [Laetiporus sulphureus 93-53]|uniref:Uncharacterized protein n=1 Tax=Laetiporus sulphureus 93-53 TaxID=1314785 RepID=A0A165BUI9_9APHY|nr:uncharacterized protein LAESUDRAFT_663435 [Laetiporus sulphureus 93-53]KZT01678.1 hypothetical protein LAESUDRAFT_663435 [Laetiporus sulphureus 93-53]